MKINRLEFYNEVNKWHLNETAFDDLILLVGASGVGKTRILKAIDTLKRIANGEAFNGVKWKINFSDSSGNTYDWSGQFKKYEDRPLRSEWESSYAEILTENIFLNKEKIAFRSGEKTTFKGQKIPKLSYDYSLIKLLKEEDLIKPIYQSFRKIVFDSYDDKIFPNVMGDNISEEDIGNFTQEYSALNDSYELSGKLYLFSLKKPEIFEEIKEIYKEIFPLIEDMKVEPEKKLSNSVHFNVHVYVKEKGIKKWLSPFNLSSGMYKTLLLISEIYLCPDGTVILLDEFENSLGTNCINDVTSAILSSGRDIQFIITSHHPYIINNIDFKYWRIVTRKGSEVTINPAEKFNLGRSKHKAFMQLINLEAYRTGIAS